MTTWLEGQAAVDGGHGAVDPAAATAAASGSISRDLAERDKRDVPKTPSQSTVMQDRHDTSTSVTSLTGCPVTKATIS